MGPRRLSATTNRTFGENGKETNGTGTPQLLAGNELAKRLFDKDAISPEDDCTFEPILEEILGLPAGTAIGAEQLDLSDGWSETLPLVLCSGVSVRFI